MGSKSAIGIGNGICFKQVRDKGGGSYIDPLVRDSIVGLWKFDQNTNESPTSNIIKNAIKDKGGDLELLNFGYKLNSGYGKYEEDFTTWKISKPGIVSTINVNSIHITRIGSSLNKAHAFFENATTTNKKLNIKLRISGLTSDMKCTLNNQNSIIKELVNGVNELSVDLVIGWYGFTIIKLDGSVIGDCDITIEQIPSHQGALVTDGVDDMIVSQKTVQEMLGGSKEITVVSMIHQIGRLATDTNLFTNCIWANTGSKGHNIVNYQTSLGKTGIYGYSRANVSVANNEVVINNILGDKADYLTNVSIGALTSNEKFSVVGYLDVSPQQVTSVAVYWTFISSKVLTTDEINQIIAYFKLDKYVTPQVIYDVKRQGLTNDTPDSDWYLKDFSKNGFDMSLFNFAKKLGSGIGKYEVDFNTWIPQSYVADSTYTSNKLHVTNIKGANAILYTRKGANAMKVKITGIQSFNLVYRYIAENDVWEALKVDRDGIYELPASTTTTKTYYTGFAVPYYTGGCDITIKQIPDYEGALVSDGVDDYGKVENLPIYKDYTVAIDRVWTNDLVKDQCLTSKLNGDNFGSFSFELIEDGFSSYSFGISNKGVITIDSNKKISYQSKYVYNGSPITSGNNVDGKDLFLFRNQDSYPYYAEAAIWSYILFPYSLSEFLLERQLKRYKLGTLYPDMVEFRPIIKNNNQYRRLDFYTQSWDKKICPGDYVPINSILRANIYLNNELDELQSFRINGVNVTFVKSSVDKTAYNIGNIPIAKSPQKIDIIIDEYIRFEDIIQPYPAIVNLSQDGKSITWGDKLKVGSDIVFAESANLLPELYTVSDTRYNGVTLYPNTIIKVEKSMVFDTARIYLKANEPNCILSPNRLRIPNSSYKILRYIPDLTGKGNHGKLNNFAYTEDSGVASDGSIKIDGTDDHITISNIIGGKCIMAKVTVNSNSGIIYDQRRANVPNKSWMQLNSSSVIFEQNAVSTYIDGILNHNVTGSDLVSKTVNLTCELEIGDTSGTYKPTIGSSYAVEYTTDINLYEFMLFPDMPDEEEIKELNEVMGIEGGYVESPNYYWDVYGKKNTDTDRNLIADQVNKDVANALEVKNVGYNSESGYTDDNGLLLDGVEDYAVNTIIPAVTDFTVIAKRISQASTNNTMFITKGKDGVVANSALGLEYRNANGQYVYSFGKSTNIKSIPDLITYCTPTNYNGKVLKRGEVQDTNGIQIGKFGVRRWKGVFYKLMFYTKIIDQLSINMLKNLFERDELIDVTNPIFKKEEL